MPSNLVSLITKRGAERASRLANNVETFLKGLGKEVCREDVPEGVSLVVVLGGDGTLLHVAEAAYRRGAPILGVNLGGLGYLTEIRAEEVEDDIMDFYGGRALLEERMLLDITHQDKEGHTLNKYVALNEVAILRGPFGKVINLPTWANESFLTTYRGDGLIISTPTGSTAYNLSAGGPILHPTLEAMILTPVCPFALSARAILLSSEMTLKVAMEVYSRKGNTCKEKDSPPPLYVEVDGRTLSGVLPGHRLLVKKARGKLRLIGSPSRGYFQILREKLGWAGHLSTR